ncbi:RNA polymerase sigma factor [Caulobacter sp. X]|uniref:RNA polymerase sigma factor n=1 Tax=Caulobacter sp. X TaxID=2048901 RepID=UPI001F003DF9|nr:sigma-70 family RNA polymerase sigma factor [Caulobacter sp. X]
MNDDPHTQPTPSLVLAYIARREDMRRFFSVRTRAAPDVEDLMQDLFLKVQRVDGAAIENPSAYLYRLASNLLLDRLRARRRSEARDADWRSVSHTTVDGADIADAPDAEAAVDARLRLERLTQALAELPPRTRQVFWLHKIDGLTHAQTAEQLGISRSAVEKHMTRTLQHLLAKVGR